NSTQEAGGFGDVWDTMYILGPSISKIKISTTLTSTDVYNQGFWPEVCALNSDVYVHECVYLPSPHPTIEATVNGWVTLNVHADSVVASGGFNVPQPYANTEGSIDNIAVLDEYDHPLPNVKYCTASWRVLPVQNGTWQTCFPYKWILLVAESVKMAAVGSPF